MKTKSIIAFCGMAAVMMTASCSSEQNEPTVAAKEAALEISVEGIEKTRAVIDTEYLPSGSEFSLWAWSKDSEKAISGGENVLVQMNGYTATPKEAIYIPANDTVAVSAIYPFNSDFKDRYVELDCTKGEDYLWGEGLQYATSLQPKVGIRFHHLLSRITLHFTVTEDNETSYDFKAVYLRGDGDYQARKLIVDAFTGKIEEYMPSDYEDIPGILNSTMLRKGSDLTVTFLVAPTYSDRATYWNVKLDSTVTVNNFELPEANYDSGYNYIYNVQISDGDKLIVTDCEIAPWENTEMPEINITE